MEDKAGARARGPDRGEVPDIEDGPFRVNALKVLLVGTRFDDGNDLGAPGLHRPGDRGPDEPRSPGDDHPVPALDAGGAGSGPDIAGGLCGAVQWAAHRPALRPVPGACRSQAS